MFHFHLGYEQDPPTDALLLKLLATTANQKSGIVCEIKSAL